MANPHAKAATGSRAPGDGTRKRDARMARRASRTGLILPALLLLAACAPREWLLPRLGLEVPRFSDFPADYRPPLANETDQPMGGFGGGGGGIHRTPVIFVHGNTVSAAFWKPARAYFRQKGYTGDELWALSYGWNNVRYLDSAELSVPSLSRFVASVQSYIYETTGERVHQFDLIGHSLGVTLVRQWMKQDNAWHRVRRFIGVAGANDGVWTAWPDSRAQQRPVSHELYPGSPWLSQLSRGGETPGPTRYMMLYDGSGWADVLFPRPYQDSGALEGAYNLPYNREHGTWYDHMMLPREPETMDAMIAWLRSAPDAVPGAEPPDLIREGRHVRPTQTGAEVRCAMDVDYPDQDTVASDVWVLNAHRVTTCYAWNPRTHLAGPMRRYKYVPGYVPPAQPLTVTATLAEGAYEQPQYIGFEASDPQAFIVYNTSGSEPDSGSPLFTEPVFLPAPVTVRAMAVAPDGRSSAPIRVPIDISLELVEAAHTLQRQFDADTPLAYEGKRRKGN